MKKKLRNLLSLILAVAMVATTMPVDVKAADPTGFSMTGIDQNHIAGGHLMVNVSPNLTTAGLVINSQSGWSAVTQVPCKVGTSAEDAVDATANAYGIWGTQILFESLLSGNPTATYIQFAKDTQFVWGDATFTLKHEFVVVNNEGTWEVQLPTFEMTTVDAGVSGDTHLMMNLDKNLTTLGVTLQSNTMQFTNGCFLKYDADAVDPLSNYTGTWVPAYTEVGVTGIYYDVPADDNGLKTTLYVKLNWASADDYNKFAGKILATADMWITRADGTRLEVGNIGIDSNPESKAFSIYVPDGFAEGDVLHIKQNGIALHATEKIGLTFTNNASFYFEEGAWVYDIVGPEIYHDGTLVVDDATVDAKAGQNKSVFESYFYAADTMTGLADIVFVYSDGALDSNGNLVAGAAHTLTMTADDGHGNVTIRTITLNVNVVINLGDSNNDDSINAIDLVGLKKAIAGNSANTALYDLDGNGVVDAEDAAYLRAVLAGKYSIVAGQTVSLPTYEGSAVLFADFPTDQGSETAVTTYFGANFTHMLMTEDTIALKSGDSVNSSYLNAMNLIQMHGDVIVRNGQGAGASFVDKSITGELANAGAKNFYYWDEPTLTELQNGTLNDLITWHNTYNSDAMFHVNLFPSYATASDIGSSYTDYMRREAVMRALAGRK